MGATTWFLILAACAGGLSLFHVLFGPDANYRRSLRRTHRSLSSPARDVRPPAPAQRSAAVGLTPLRERLEYLNRDPPSVRVAPSVGDQTRATQTVGSPKLDRPDPAPRTPKPRSPRKPRTP